MPTQLLVSTVMIIQVFKRRSVNDGKEGTKVFRPDQDFHIFAELIQQVVIEKHYIKDLDQVDSADTCMTRHHSSHIDNVNKFTIWVGGSDGEMCALVMQQPCRPYF